MNPEINQKLSAPIGCAASLNDPLHLKGLIAWWLVRVMFIRMFDRFSVSRSHPETTSRHNDGDNQKYENIHFTYPIAQNSIILGDSGLCVGDSPVSRKQSEPCNLYFRYGNALIHGRPRPLCKCPSQQQYQGGNKPTLPCSSM